LFAIRRGKGKGFAFSEELDFHRPAAHFNQFAFVSVSVLKYSVMPGAGFGAQAFGRQEIAFCSWTFLDHLVDILRLRLHRNPGIRTKMSAIFE
jgi:hypothetical protein